MQLRCRKLVMDEDWLDYWANQYSVETDDEVLNVLGSMTSYDYPFRRWLSPQRRRVLASTIEPL